MVDGVDYAFSRPSPPRLYAAGKHFACRYGGPGTSDKHLTAAEAEALTRAGLAVVANAEGTADGLLGGWPAGQRWASSADAHFRACGMPPDRPIYLSIDFDATDAQLKGVLADAFLGARSVLGYGRVGVYGSYRVVRWARANGLAQWFWQTYAWSTWTDPDGVRRLHWAPGNHIEQYHNGVSLAGGTLDLDRALTADYGQWKVGASIGGDMGTIDPAQWQPLSDTADRVWKMFSEQYPAIMAALKAIAERVDIGPEELAAVEAAARAGAAAAADDFVARVVAGLPEGTLTRDDVEAAVRNVLRSV